MGLKRRLRCGYDPGSRNRTVRRLVQDGCVEALRAFPSLYWTFAPCYYRQSRSFDVDTYATPLDPYRVVAVDPVRIHRFTGRQYPPWENRRQLFGSVSDGDWDRRLPSPDRRNDYHEDLYLARSFEETTLHRSLEAHFVDGVPWRETAFVCGLCEWLAERDSVWHGCTSETEILDRCRRIDVLYRSIDEDGYRTQRALTAGSRPAPNFLSALENEIVVDIARDGELRFVSGRHRLSIAKILGLDRIPVAFLVRHADWVSTCADPRSNGPPPEHPDWRMADGVEHRSAYECSPQSG